MNERLSDIEERVVKLLYKNYKAEYKVEPVLAKELFRKLKIKDGTYVALLNSSKYLSMILVGTHEAF